MTTPTERVPCPTCGSLILPSTALANDGGCAPCSRKSQFVRELESRTDTTVFSMPLRLASSRAKYFRDTALIHGQALLETLGKHGIVEETVIERFQNEPELFVLDEAEIWSKNGIEIDYVRRLADDFEIGSGEQLPTREDCLKHFELRLKESQPD